MIFQVLLEGLGLGVLLVLVCWFGIRKGAVGMVHLYHEDVQERCVKLGLTTREKIRRNSLLPSGVYRLRARLRIRRQRNERLLDGPVAAVRHSVRHEPDRPLPRGRLVGRAYKSLDDPRHGRSQAVYHPPRQARQMDRRHGRLSGDFGGARGDHDAFRPLTGDFFARFRAERINRPPPAYALILQIASIPRL